MRTQLKGRESLRAKWGPLRIKCPRCGHVDEYDQNDLHFGQETG